MTQGHLQAVQPPQSHHIIYHLGAFTGFSTYHSHFTLYTTQGHLQAVQPTTVTSHYIRLRGICRLSTYHSHITLYTTQGHLQAVQPPQSHHIIYHLGAFTGFSTYHSHFTLYTTQGHLQAVQPTTVTSHYIRLSGICSLFNPPQSHHIIYDLGALAGCSTTTVTPHYIRLRGICRLSQPITVTSHYIRLRGICRLFNPPQSHHIIYHLGAFVGFSTYHSHITLYTTQGHLQAVQPTTVHHIIYHLGAFTGTSHYIRLRGICRLFNPPQSHHIIYDLGAFVASSTHHSHITLYTTQGHLQAVQPTTVTSHYIRLRGICSLFNPPQSHHIIYELGAFVGCSTLHSHITLYTTQGHMQDVQPPQLQQIIYDLGAFVGCSTSTVTSHYIRLRGICSLFNPPQSHHIIYDLGAFVGCSTYHSHITLYTTQGHLQAVQPTTVTSHYIRLSGICSQFNPPQSHHIIYDLGAFAGCSTHHSHITLYTTQGHLQASQLRGIYHTLYTTQGHLQAVQPTTVTSHYIRLRGICRLFNPPQSHHIIYDLGAFAGFSTYHSHFTLYTTQGHLQAVQPTTVTLYTTQGHLQASQPITVTSHYIRLRGICRLFNPPQSHHIIYDLVAFVASSTHHSHITLYMTQGHLQAVQPPQSHHIIYHLGAFTGFSTYHSHFTLYTTQGHLQAVQPTTVTPHYIPLRGIYRLLNLSQSLHIIYDLGAFAGCSTHHSHITLYTTQWHLQPVQPTTVTSHYIRLRGICRLLNLSTVTSHYIRLRGICRLFNPPQSHHIIYHLGAFTGFSTYHSHFTLYTTQGHLQAVQPTTVTSHYLRLSGICSQFNPPQSHHIIYDLGALAGCSTYHSHITLYTTQGHLQAVQPTTVTPHYIRLRGICRLFNPPQSHHIIYDLGAFAGCSTHHSHITLFTTQWHLQPVQPTTVTSHYIRLRGTCRLFNHHSHTTLYTTQGHLQASQPITVTSHYIRLRGICRLFNPPQSHHIIYHLGAFTGFSTYHSHFTLYTTQGHLQAVQPTTVTSHYLRLSGICSQFNPPQSHHIIYDLGAFVGCSTSTVTSHYIRLRGICRLFNHHSHNTLYTTQGHLQAVQPPQSHHIIYDLGAFAGCSTHHSHITLYTTQGHLQPVQPTTVTSHYIRLRGICRLFNPPQSHHIIYDLGAFVGCSTTTVTSHIIYDLGAGCSTTTVVLRGICRLFNPPQSHHIIYELGAFVFSDLFNSTTVTSHYIRLRGICNNPPPQSHHIIYDLGQAVQPTTVICRLFNPPQSHHIIYDLGAFAGVQPPQFNPPQSHHIIYELHFNIMYMTQGHLQLTSHYIRFRGTVTSHYIRLRGTCRMFNHHSYNKLYTTQGHLQAVQPTTVTSHYIRLRGICRLFNPPQSHHIIYDLGALVACSTHHSHITLYTTQGHLQPVQPTTVTSHYIRLRGICRLSTLHSHSHITLYTRGIRGTCRMFNHHSYNKLYTNQGHLQAFTSHYIRLRGICQCSTHHHHIIYDRGICRLFNYIHYIRLRGICRLFNPPQSHHIIYDLGAFAGCSTTTVTSHYIRLRGICRLFNPPQSHHIIYDLGAFVGCSTHHSHITLYTTQGHLQAVQPPQSQHIIYDLGAFVGCSTHHSHITLYTTQGHLQAVQPTTVTSHYIRLRGICRLFNLHSHITLYTTQGHLQASQDLGAFAGCSTHHSHITLYTAQGILGIYRLLNLSQSLHITYELGAFAG